MSAILTIAAADALERVRRFTFLIVVALALYAGYLYVPDAHAAYTTVAINGHRGLYDSGYVGAATSLLTVLFLSLVGFFFVRGSVQRDWELHVDGTVASSRVSRTSFLLGKFLSNLGVLVLVAAFTAAAGILMQEWHGEDRAFNALSYMVPLVAITVPAMAFVAAIAIVFDVIKPLRGICGGVVFVMIIWFGMVVLPVNGSHGLTKTAPLDPLGMSTIVVQLYDAETAAYPKDRGKENISIGGEPAPRGGFRTYGFSGLHWSVALIGARAFWLLVSVALVLLAAPLFDRFRRDAVHRQKGEGRFNAAVLIPNIPALGTVRAEFALLVNGANIWWLLGALALIIAQFAAPMDALANVVVPAAFIWPLERISQLGARERFFHMNDILQATAGYTRRAVLVQWAAGAALATLLLCGFVVRLLLSGNATGACAVLVIAAAIAGTALFFGTLTGAPRTFQAIFLVAWYLGPINHLPELDVALAPLKFAPAAVGAGASTALAAVIFTILTRRMQRAAR